MKITEELKNWIRTETLILLTYEPLNVSALAKVLKVNRATADGVTAYMSNVYEEDNGDLKIMGAEKMTKAETEDYCEVLQDRIKQLKKENEELKEKLEKYENQNNK